MEDIKLYVMCEQDIDSLNHITQDETAQMEGGADREKIPVAGTGWICDLHLSFDSSWRQWKDTPETAQQWEKDAGTHSSHGSL